MARRRITAFFTWRLLRINADPFQSSPPAGLVQRARRILDPADVFVEEETSVSKWLKANFPTASVVMEYVGSLLPSVFWLRRYTIRWLLWDALAGLTVSLVVIPQALAHASLARLSPNLGLYTSFSGNAVYWIFGTSKDMVIGTTSVSSLMTNRVVSRVMEATSGRFNVQQVVCVLTASLGLIFFTIGFLRLGWFVEFIPNVPISAFVTASSITMLASQTPLLLGLEDINTQRPPYLVFISIMQQLHQMRWDAFIGLSHLAFLFFMQYLCSVMQVRQPRHKRFWMFLKSLRMTVGLFFLTMLSAVIHRFVAARKVHFRVVGNLQQGFRAPGLEVPSTTLARLVLEQIPAVLCLAIIGHAAISKAMGRLNDYPVHSSQEMVALGAANMFSSLIGGYICTGSFNSAAVVSAVGVRTPLAGVVTASILAVAIQYFGYAFLYIPRAALASVVVHAALRLPTPPHKLYMIWRLSPAELVIWLACVTVGIFVALEAAVYVGLCMCLILLLYKLAKADGVFLGVVRAARLDHGGRPWGSTRPVYLPLHGRSTTNPRIKVDSPYPGVFMFRLNDGFIYVNQARLLALMLDHVRGETSKGTVDASEEPRWSASRPRCSRQDEDKTRPRLRAIVLDFCAVSGVDVTAVQGLVDARTVLDRHTWPDRVEWHFSNVYDGWTRRRLAAAGFGFPAGSPGEGAETLSEWKPMYSIAATMDETKEETEDCRRCQDGREDAEAEQAKGYRHDGLDSEGDGNKKMMAVVTSVDRPYFHVDLEDALECATQEAMRKDGRDASAVAVSSELRSGDGVSRQGV
ncbi:hypothetical protein CDD82_5044 [Ophiocordyceps australis]|uniref:STAS domain-containing protein n=1 Tax=Ophiocordyceps australis TaxID=1399860 RepID=A0A2C5Z4B0_9HYPO|nr:hypothetical protein CDD82_5044 [Ophiocordyceps australis]